MNLRKVFNYKYLLTEMLSLVIPTYNEEENITELLNRIENSLKGIRHETIIVDDGTDKTASLALETAKNKGYPVRVYKRARKRGLASAVIDGIKLSKGELIGIMDADLQHPPELLSTMLKKLQQERADIVIASRFSKGAKVDFGLWRTFVSKVFIFLSHICIPKTHYIKDTSTGFFIFRKKVISGAKLEPIGFKILLEILAKGNYNKVVEIPFHFKKRGAGKSKFNLRQIIISFKHLIRLAKSQREHIRFGKFCAVGASGIAVNEGLLWLLTEFAGLFYLISGAIAIEASILSNFVLNDLWTFRKERKGKYLTRLGKFNFARIIILIINFGALWLFTWLGIHYLISNLIGIALATVFTYFTSLLWVWK